jgi:hypothetical protein
MHEEPRQSQLWLPPHEPGLFDLDYLFNNTVLLLEPGLSEDKLTSVVLSALADIRKYIEQQFPAGDNNALNAFEAYCLRLGNAIVE